MNAIENEVKELTEIELADANNKFPLFASAHEGYAVILEELQETAEQLKAAEEILTTLFKNIRDNQTELAAEQAARLKQAAQHGAIEFIQVAAMAQKFIDSEQARKNPKVCEYCNGTKALYQEARNTKLYINTIGAAQALYTSVKFSDREPPIKAAFIIEHCPNCGREL